MSRANDTQMTIAELAAIIRRTIEELVLPDLPRTSWTSGYLHSAVALLANIEARAPSERALAIDEGTALDALLLEARRLIASIANAGTLAAEIDRSLATPTVPLDQAGADDLDARNTVLARALNSLIVWTYANRNGAAAGCAPQLLALFARYREGTVARSEALLGDAPGRPIF